LEKVRVSRHFKVVVSILLVALPLYVLSIGPVAWATNDAEHPAYLPDEMWLHYLPLVPLTKLPGVSDAF